MLANSFQRQISTTHLWCEEDKGSHTSMQVTLSWTQI